MPRACAARDERGERLVAAEQRVDAVERRRVVAVRAARREDRRQVERRSRRALDVVEVLPRRRARSPPNHSHGVSGPRPGRELVPVARHGPAGRLAAPRPAVGEAVGEDLVDDRAAGASPVRAGSSGEEEVVRVGHVVPDERRRRSARRSRRRRRRAASGSGVTGFVDREGRAPPRLGLRLVVDDGLDVARLAVADVAERDRGRRPRRAGRAGARPPRRRARPAARARRRRSRRGAAGRAASRRRSGARVIP